MAAGLRQTLTTPSEGKNSGTAKSVPADAGSSFRSGEISMPFSEIRGSLKPGLLFTPA